MSKWAQVPAPFLKLQFPGNNKLSRFAATLTWGGGVCSVLLLSAQVWSSEPRMPSVGFSLLALLAALKTSSVTPAGFALGCASRSGHVSELGNVCLWSTFKNEGRIFSNRVIQLSPVSPGTIFFSCCCQRESGVSFLTPQRLYCCFGQLFR